MLNISSEYLDRVKAEQIEEIKRRSSLYRNNNSINKFNYENNVDNAKTVILADDGSATGATLIAAARWIKNKGSSKQLIIAVPIAPKDIVSLLKKEADYVEVIIAPSKFSFKAVGQYYQSFEQITDEQVIEVMRKRGLV